MSEQFETDLKASELLKVLLKNRFPAPIRFNAESKTEAAELLWRHKDGRVSVYVESATGYTIEDVPYGETYEVKTIAEVIEVFNNFKFLKNE